MIDPVHLDIQEVTGIGLNLPDINEKIEIGKSKIIKEGKKLAILNFGARLNESLKAS